MAENPQSSIAESPIAPERMETGNGFVLYDRTVLSRPDAEFFEPSHWRGAGMIVREAQGRYPVCIFRYREQVYVLRHYHRGGMAARFLRDRYLWTGLENSRAWLEWRLLAKLHGAGLPVPRPVAARLIRHGPFYSADLVTEYIDETRTMADALMQGGLADGEWNRIGSVIKRFHTAGVFHADLNARNILLDGRGRVFLVDFDKGHQGEMADEACLSNLERLQRSLKKLKAGHGDFHYDDDAWRSLLSGYRDGG